MKKIHRLLQGRKGMTMAEVLVAFAIFAMLLLMFQRTVTLSSHVMQSSEDVRRQTERLYDAFYQQTAYTLSLIHIWCWRYGWSREKTKRFVRWSTPCFCRMR